ncbi:MAG: hypothetical protein V1679_00705, partial [Candidatus Peregrinibacteria bacterium]
SLGVKPKDSKNRYTLGFLAFLSERYAPLSSSPVNAPHFENTKSIYQKLAGNAPLEGNPEDVRKGRELAKNSFLWANKSQIYSYIRNQYYKGTEAQADEPQATADVNVTGIRNLNYRFTALKNHKLYPAEGRPGQRIGNFCCAYSVSTWLGLGEDSGDKRGKPGNVGRLAAKLIKGNMERTNGADNGMIKTGIETLERGDVTIFGNFNSLHHVGLITFNKRIEIRDENGDSLGHHEIIGFNHTGKRINFDPMLIVASGNKRVMKALHASLQNPDFRNKHPELQEMWEIQGPGKRISITDKREWQKKAGKYAFAIRTRNLQAPESMIA